MSIIDELKSRLQETLSPDLQAQYLDPILKAVSDALQRGLTQVTIPVEAEVADRLREALTPQFSLLNFGKHNTFKEPITTGDLIAGNQYNMLVLVLDQPGKVAPPFMAGDLPSDYVERSAEFENLLSGLVDKQTGKALANRVVLHGAAGFGKATLAQAACHDRRVREAFDGGVLWVTLGEEPGELTGRTQDLIYMLTGERDAFASIDAAIARYTQVLDKKQVLIVIDDLTNAAHARPFLQGGPNCARLITTRDTSTAPPDALRVPVDEMQPEEASKLLGMGLPQTNMDGLSKLASRLGRWPLLLKLVNGVLRDRVQSSQQLLSDALASVNSALDRRGLTAFDTQSTVERDQAVALTMSISFERLTPEERARYAELAIFPEHVKIPLAIIEKLWSATGVLDGADTEELCVLLKRFSLLQSLDLAQRTITLHSVVRSYLYGQGRGDLAVLNNRLLDAYGLQLWADLPLGDPYLWDFLAYHLTEAGRADELITTMKDPRYLTTKIYVRNALAAEGDLAAAEAVAPGDQILSALRKTLAQAGNLLNMCVGQNDVGVTLYSRIQHLEDLAAFRLQLESILVRPYLAPLHPLPDLPHPALMRTLQGQTAELVDCAISADGSTIVAVSPEEEIGIVEVWDAIVGSKRFVLSGHKARVWCCAIDATGGLIASGSEDGLLKLWNGRDGTELLSVQAHKGEINSCAVSADGTFVVTASDDKRVKVWDSTSGSLRFTLSEHKGAVHHCAISADGTVIVSASEDKTVKVWDSQTGELRLTLKGHNSRVNGCALNGDGAVIVSASEDGKLRVWDGRTGKRLKTIKEAANEYPSVDSCAISPDGAIIVSTSAYGAVRVRDGRTYKEILTLYEDSASPVWSCGIRADGAVAITTIQGTVKIWDVQSSIARSSPQGRVAWGCAVAGDGKTAVTASYDAGLKVWNAQYGTESFTLGKTPEAEPVTVCSISEDGALAVSSTSLSLGNIPTTLWDLNRRTSEIIFPEEVGLLSWDGTFVVLYLLSLLSEKTGGLRIWDATSREERLVLTEDTIEPDSVAISRDSSVIVGIKAGMLKGWSSRTGEELFTLAGLSKNVLKCATSTDGKRIVTAHRDGTLSVWGPATATAQPLLVLDGRLEMDSVQGCAISPNGNLIASAASDIHTYDGVLKVWDAQSGHCVTTLRVNGALFDCVWFSDDQRLMAVGVNGVYFLHLLS